LCWERINGRKEGRKEGTKEGKAWNEKERKGTERK
jgi:hypothetical protein